MEVCGVRVFVQQKNIKNLHLRVGGADGAARVSAPLRVSQKYIADFVAKNIEWVKKQQANLRQTSAKQVFQTGQKIAILGRGLEWQIVPAQKNKIEICGNLIYFFQKNNLLQEEKQKIFKKWRKKQVQKILEGVFKKWQKLTNLAPSGVVLRDMKTRWGTCNHATKKIAINVQILHKPPQCVEYLVLHELLHIIEPSHNQKFKAYLDSFMPNWRTIRRALKR